MRRLVVLLSLLVLLVALAAVAARALVVPYAEGKAADAIGARLDAHVRVHATAPLSLGLAHGQLGDLVVSADRLQRDGIEVDGVQGRIRRVRLDLGSLLGGTAKVSFQGMRLGGSLPQASLTMLLRRRLAASGVPGAARARVVVQAGKLVLVTPAGRVASGVRVAGPTSLALAPQGLPAGVARSLSRPIELGPLPYGLRLRSLALRPGSVLVTATRGAGTEQLG